MTSNRIRSRLAAAAGLALSAAVFLTAADSRGGQPGDLTIHEWGTFTSVAGEDGTAIGWDALGCRDDLPGFVNDYGYRGFKWTLRGTVRMETPVMFFYSAGDVDAHVKVAFPQGLITEWYPQAEYEVYQRNRLDGSLRRLQANLNGIDTSLRTLTGAIEWKKIKVRPDIAQALPVETGPSRYYAARETDAASITVGDQHERFLFYRGVGRFAVPLSARLSSDGEIEVENRGRDPVPRVVLFENRNGRMRYRDAGALQDTVTIGSPLPDGSPTELRDDLETALVAQGLFPKEAHAMLETWQDSWFEEGSRLIYVVPSRVVDAILPVQVDPSPLQTVRVFVGRIELVTPETMRSVETAFATGNWSMIDRYSRFLEPILARIHPEDPFMVASQLEERRRRKAQEYGAGYCL